VEAGRPGGYKARRLESWEAGKLGGWKGCYIWTQINPVK